MKKIILLSVIIALGSSKAFSQSKVLLTDINVGFNLGLPKSNFEGHSGFAFGRIQLGAYLLPIKQRFGGGIEYTKSSKDMIDETTGFRKLELQGAYRLLNNLDARVGLMFYKGGTGTRFYQQIAPTGASKGFEVNDVAIPFASYGNSREVLFNSANISTGLQYRIVTSNEDYLVRIYGDVIARFKKGYKNQIYNCQNCQPWTEEDPDPNEAMERAGLNSPLGGRIGVKVNGMSNDYINLNAGFEIGKIPSKQELYLTFTFGMSINFIDN